MALDAEVWKQVFQELIQEVKPWHRWTLTPDKGLLPDVLKPGWMQYQQWVFARFQCSSCSRSWASAQVQVLFHMHWSEEKSRGQVKMRVFAQRCKKCSQPPFEVPEFTLENISRILNNLVLRILKKCYRERFKSMEEIPMIKEVSLEGPHDRDNCEACLQGCCAEGWLGPAEGGLGPAEGWLGLAKGWLGPAEEPPEPRSPPPPPPLLLPLPLETGRLQPVVASLFAEPTQAMSLPTSWIPRANATCPSGEHFSSYAPRSHTRRNIVGTCCCLLLLIVVVVVIIKTL
nr:receptor-transporting protein 3 [Microcebus murinus]